MNNQRPAPPSSLHSIPIVLVPLLLLLVRHYSPPVVSSFIVVQPTRIVTQNSATVGRISSSSSGRSINERGDNAFHFLEQRRRINNHGFVGGSRNIWRERHTTTATATATTTLFANLKISTEKSKSPNKEKSIDPNSVVGVKEMEVDAVGVDSNVGNSDKNEKDDTNNQDDDSSSQTRPSITESELKEHTIGSNGDETVEAPVEFSDKRKGKNQNNKRKGGKSELFPSSEKSSASSSSSSSSSWTDWSASSSLGSFLLKRKKMEEEEMQKIQESSTASVHVGVGEYADANANDLNDVNLASSLNANESGGDGKKSDINEPQKSMESSEKGNNDDKTIAQKNLRGKEKDDKQEIFNFVNATSTSVQREIDQTFKNLASLTSGKKDKDKDMNQNIVVGEDKGKENDSVDEEDILTGLDEELVREVDESITILTASRQNLMRDIDVLPLDQSQQQQQPQKQKQPLANDDDPIKVDNYSSSLLPLSGPDHTRRIERDMRHLAVSIASTVENAEQWKEFCEDGGGLLPLLECIRIGAKEIEQGIDDDQYSQRTADDVGLIGLIEQKEEAFVAAWTACKTLRDLCAISKPFAAIVTDSILRANAAWSTKVEQKDGTIKLEGGIISNLVTLLRFAQQDDNFYNPRSRREKMRALRNRGIQRMGNRKQKRDARKRCGLYVTQLLLEMSFASDRAVETFRATTGLTETVLACSSYAQAKRLRRRLIRYPIEVIKRYISSKSNEVVHEESPFLAAASINNGLSGQTQGAANQLLASIGHNVWYPKTPGQRGLRILCLDGGGTRGITAISSMRSIVQAIGGVEVCDAFDMIVGTSTGAIIAFLVGLRRESSLMARKRYDRLIKRIFVKSALSTPMLLFTTATYDETPFNTVVGEILRDNSMLSSRADPRVPLVFAISSKMSSTPTQICLFRNYNYGGGEMRDAFVEDPIKAKEELNLELEDDIYKLSGMFSYEEVEGIESKQSGGSRHPGSFRVLQRAALRATTAAPTVFKPVLMGGELYCDGGIVASNPAAVAIHEARTIYPSVPIELVVSCGTGAFVEEKSEPRIGWDGIIGQIVNSATDGEQIHHILEDILGGQGGTARLGRSSVSETKYYRFNPVIGTADTFPIDGTDPIKLEELSQLTTAYMNEPEQTRKLNEIVDILKGRTGWKGRLLSKMGISP